jgi:Carboxypeptidase regulatory-like domain
MKRIITGLSVGVFMSVFACVVWGQATAQINGVVKDQSGAVLPGVEVTATQTETGIARSAVTNETGSYILPNLAVGPYRLEVSLPGFRSFVQNGIVLQVNSNPVINAVLEVGQVTEQVEVQANAVLVETRSTSVGQVIENERILELPLNGRQVTDLVTLSGAAVQTGVSPAQSMQGGVRISVAGGLSSGVSYSLDGAMHNNSYDGANLPLPFPDALQEFKVEASGLTAQNGMHSGGAVNAVTKSGTNEFHGDVFEFVRNYLFNARNFFALRRDSLKRNQYGGTLGGPILKNKLFFFGGYQGTKTRSDPGDTIRFVPTATMMAGDFTTFASPNCNAGRQIALRAPFVNNRVDPALYSKAATNLAAKLPKAQDDCGKITYGAVQKINELQTIGKVDYQRSANHSIFGRYLATTYALPPPLHFSSNLLTSTDAGFDNFAQSYALGDTYLIGPNTVNAFRATVNRTAIAREHEPFFSAREMGVDAYSSLKDYMIVTVTGGFNIGGGTQSHATFRTTAYQAGDDLSLIRGNHQMAFGGSVAQWRTNQYAHVQSVGTYSFTGVDTGLGLADFVLGRLNSLAQGSETKWATRQNYFGLYGQDTWKVTPRVTMTYGVRWEPFMPLRLTMGGIYAFDDDRFSKGIRSTVIKNAPAGLYFPGDPGFPEGAAVNKRWMDIGPRVGLAWDPQGNGRTSVRVSYGLAYDFAVGANLGNSASAPPWAFRTSVQTPAGGFDKPWRDFPGGNPFPWEFNLGDPSKAKFIQYATFLPMNRYDMVPPYVQTWNLSVQRQMPGDFLASVSYLGSETTHLWIGKDRNSAVYFPGGPCTINGVTYTPTCSTTTNTDQRRRLSLQNPQEGQYFALLSSTEDGATASYNGFLFSLQRRAASGVNFGANYTWSHCVGFGNSTGLDQFGGQAYVDPNNRNFDRGNCDGDRRQVLNMTAVAETPQFENLTMRTLASGWRLSGIYKMSTGSYMTVLSGLDRALSGIANQRAQQVLGNPFGDQSSLTNYLNPNAFAQPVLGTLGNLGRSNIVGPGTWQFDLALSRVFRVRENQRMEFRAEAFNVTNSLIKNNPNLSLNANTFGQINSSRDARIMQFALKYVF